MRPTHRVCLAIAASTALCLATPAAMASAKSVTSARFASIDGNHDGVISSGEHEDYVRKMFDLIDTNHNDRISAAELDAAEAQGKVVGHPGNAALMNSAQKIRHFDGNGDGEISDYELSNGARQLFGVMDANRNGQLSPQEFAAGW
jgi:hypothetical protein